MNAKSIVIQDFHILADYLQSSGKIKDAESYKKDLSAFLLHAQHLKCYDFVAPYCSGKDVLDIGCFIGYGTERIALYSRHVIGIDNDNKALSFAHQNRGAVNMSFENTSIKDFLLRGKKFDIVIAFQLIEHIVPGDIEDFLLDVKNILNRGGVFFVVTPNRSTRLLPLQKPFNREHYQEFTAKSLGAILRKIFSDVAIKGVRASPWIEDIEKKRVRQSPWRVYLRDPVIRFFAEIMPFALKNPIKKAVMGSVRETPSFALKRTCCSEKQKNANDIERFSIDDFYLSEEKINKSLSLFALCRD
jgi:2-polyprenyl-3-methyl-5-hydroxy-6-metoxy-1,4-benzoquinol methylase